MRWLPALWARVGILRHFSRALGRCLLDIIWWFFYSGHRIPLVQVPRRKFIVAGTGGFEVCPSVFMGSNYTRNSHSANRLVLFLYILIIYMTKIFSVLGCKKAFFILVCCMQLIKGYR